MSEKTAAQIKAEQVKAERAAQAAREKAEAEAAKAAAPAKQRRARLGAVVLPTYSIKKTATGDILNLLMKSEITTKPDIDQDSGEVKKITKGPKKGEPAEIHLVHVVDMDTGEEGELLLPFLMHKGLAGLGKITGRAFEMTKGEAESNKATKWTVYEIAAD